MQKIKLKITSFGNRLSAYFFDREKGISYPETFLQELNHQCNRVLFFATIITLSWLLYIPLDQVLHPDKPGIIVLRLGFPSIGLLVLVLRFWPKFKQQGVLFLSVYAIYLEIATAAITGLAGGDNAYIGGYLFVLMLLAVAPLPRWISWSILFVSVSTFFLISLRVGVDFTSPNMRYSLNDLVNTAIVGAFFIFITDRIRWRTWQKSKHIELQNEQMKQDKQKIDSLLLNILPKDIAEEMKATGHVQPVYNESATVVFTDFVGFSKIAEILSPEALVKELDFLFSAFDDIIEKYQLEKLKTIGDSYMFAAGVPIASDDHEKMAVAAAAEILRFIKMRSHPIPWQIRIGINTGPIMSGVVGKKKFVYDIWGNTVNIASRMESSSEPNRVTVSEYTYSKAKKYYPFEHKGQFINSKGGKIVMYTLQDENVSSFE